MSFLKKIFQSEFERKTEAWPMESLKLRISDLELKIPKIDKFYQECIKEYNDYCTNFRSTHEVIKNFSDRLNLLENALHEVKQVKSTLLSVLEKFNKIVENNKIKEISS